MSEKISVPFWFWIVAVVALIWNLMGVLNYINQVTMPAEVLETLSENQQTYLKRYHHGQF